MSISNDTRKAYAEVDEFLDLLTNEQKSKIPQKLREYFKEEKDQSYKKGINPKIPIKNQNLKEETLGIIALLNLHFWCEDEKEKDRLMRIYSNNDRIYQDMFQIEFNSDAIFGNTISNTKEEKETTQDIKMVEYKESLIKRIINGILKFIHLK